MASLGCRNPPKRMRSSLWLIHSVIFGCRSQPFASLCSAFNLSVLWQLAASRKSSCLCEIYFSWWASLNRYQAVEGCEQFQVRWSRCMYIQYYAVCRRQFTSSDTWIPETLLKGLSVRSIWSCINSIKICFTVLTSPNHYIQTDSRPWKHRQLTSLDQLLLKLLCVYVRVGGGVKLITIYYIHLKKSTDDECHWVAATTVSAR